MDVVAALFIYTLVFLFIVVTVLLIIPFIDCVAGPLLMLT